MACFTDEDRFGADIDSGFSCQKGNNFYCQLALISSCAGEGENFTESRFGFFLGKRICPIIHLQDILYLYIEKSKG